MASSSVRLIAELEAEGFEVRRGSKHWKVYHAGRLVQVIPHKLRDTGRNRVAMLTALRRAQRRDP